MPGPPDTNTPSVHVIKFMHLIHHNSFMYQDNDIIQIKTATFAPCETASSARRYYAHNKIYANFLIQALWHDSYTNDTFLNPKKNDLSSSHFCIFYFAVCKLLSTITMHGICAVS